MSLPILCRFVTRTQRPAENQAIMVVKVSLKVRLFFSLFAIMWCSSLSCMLELPPAGVMYDYVIQLYWLWPNKKLNQHYKRWIMPFSWFINVIKQAPENRKRLKLVIIRDHTGLHGRKHRSSDGPSVHLDKGPKFVAPTVHLMDGFGRWTKIIILRWTSGRIFDHGPSTSWTDSDAFCGYRNEASVLVFSMIVFNLNFTADFEHLKA